MFKSNMYLNRGRSVSGHLWSDYCIYRLPVAELSTSDCAPFQFSGISASQLKQSEIQTGNLGSDGCCLISNRKLNIFRVRWTRHNAFHTEYSALINAEFNGWLMRPVAGELH